MQIQAGLWLLERTVSAPLATVINHTAIVYMYTIIQCKHNLLMNIDNITQKISIRYVHNWRTFTMDIKIFLCTHLCTYLLWTLCWSKGQWDGGGIDVGQRLDNLVACSCNIGILSIANIGRVREDRVYQCFGVWKVSICIGSSHGQWAKRKKSSNNLWKFRRVRGEEHFAHNQPSPFSSRVIQVMTCCWRLFFNS